MGQAMAKLKLDYVDEYLDHAGKMRRYFRKGGKRLGALPGAVGSDEFMAAYAAYLAEKPAAAKSGSRGLAGQADHRILWQSHVYRSQAIDPTALPLCTGSGFQGTRPQVCVDHDRGKRRENHQQDR